jgi:hypothetical protein
VPEAELEAVVDGISSPKELFEVLNEQLCMVQGLSEDIQTTGLALQQSEEARSPPPPATKPPILPPTPLAAPELMDPKTGMSSLPTRVGQ